MISELGLSNYWSTFKHSIYLLSKLHDGDDKVVTTFAEGSDSFVASATYCRDYVKNVARSNAVFGWRSINTNYWSLNLNLNWDGLRYLRSLWLETGKSFSL